MNRRALLSAALSAPFLLHRQGWAALPDAEQVMARAPAFCIVLDDSSDAPARTPAVMTSAARRCGEIISELPMGGSVYVMVAGDPLRQVPLVLRSRVQARTNARGATAAQLAAQVRNFLLVDFPKTPKPDDKAGSSIILGLRDAAALLNRDAASPNQVYLVSDMLERSSLADCYRDCRLPKPDFQFVPKTRVEILGIGLRLSDQKIIALFKPWEKWLRDAGAGELKLHRSY